MALAAVTRFSSPEPVASVALRADVGQTAGLCIMKWKAMKSLFVGIDLGGTHMGLALVAENGSIRYQRKEKTLAAQVAESIPRRLKDACWEMMPPWSAPAAWLGNTAPQPSTAATARVHDVAERHPCHQITRRLVATTHIAARQGTESHPLIMDVWISAIHEFKQPVLIVGENRSS